MRLYLKTVPEGHHAFELFLIYYLTENGIFFRLMVLLLHVVVNQYQDVFIAKDFKALL